MCRCSPAPVLRFLLLLLVPLLLVLPATAVPAFQTAPVPNATFTVQTTTVPPVAPVATTPPYPATATVVPFRTTSQPVRTMAAETPEPDGIDPAEEEPEETDLLTAEPEETPEFSDDDTFPSREETGGDAHDEGADAPEGSRKDPGARGFVTDEDAGVVTGGTQATAPAVEDARIFTGVLFSTNEGRQQALSALRKDDPAVQNIRGGDNAVIIEYGRTGTLLGVIPVPYTETLTIGPGGRYEIGTSWWAAFTRHDLPDTPAPDEKMMKRAEIMQTMGNILRQQNDTLLQIIHNAK